MVTFSRCISFPKVINPQRARGRYKNFLGCISFPKVINPQLGNLLVW